MDNLCVADGCGTGTLCGADGCGTGTLCGEDGYGMGTVCGEDGYERDTESAREGGPEREVSEAQCIDDPGEERKLNPGMVARRVRTKSNCEQETL